MKRTQQGFTLIELAIVLIVLTILTAGLLVPLTTSIQTRQIQAANQSLATIQDALIGYAMSHSYTCTCIYDNTSSSYQSGGTCPAPFPPPSLPNSCPKLSPLSLSGAGTTTLTMTRHYLPCPDLTGTGTESRTGTACTNPAPNQIPRLPWLTLGLPQADAWGDLYGYDVYFNYANSGIGFSSNLPSTPSNLSVCADHTCTTYLATQVPMVVLSFGPNGAGAYNVANMHKSEDPPASALDELQNLNFFAHNYVSRTPTDGTNANGQFDDIVNWLPMNLLLNRVCPAGGCP